MKIIDGLFKYGETVALDVDGKLVKRKVHYANGELFVDVNGERIKEKELAGVRKWDKSAYSTDYNRKHRARYTATVPKEQGAKWKAEAEARGMNMNAFLIYCVEKEING